MVSHVRDANRLLKDKEASSITAGQLMPNIAISGSLAASSYPPRAEPRLMISNQGLSSDNLDE